MVAASICLYAAALPSQPALCWVMSPQHCAAVPLTTPPSWPAAHRGRAPGSAGTRPPAAPFRTCQQPGRGSGPQSTSGRRRRRRQPVRGGCPESQADRGGVVGGGWRVGVGGVGGGGRGGRGGEYGCGVWAAVRSHQPGVCLPCCPATLPARCRQGRGLRPGLDLCLAAAGKPPPAEEGTAPSGGRRVEQLPLVDAQARPPCMACLAPTATRCLPRHTQTLPSRPG